jgi:hypothetical protein
MKRRTCDVYPEQKREKRCTENAVNRETLNSNVRIVDFSLNVNRQFVACFCREIPACQE